MMTTDRNLTPEEISKFRKLTRFTTGQAAKICKVAPRTFTKWIDDPQERYFFPHEVYRLPPTAAMLASAQASSEAAGNAQRGHDRRVTRAGLVRFLAAHKMFAHLAVLQGLSRLLYAGHDRRLCQETLGTEFDVIPADSPFDLARLIKRDVPPLVIVDFGDPGQHIDPRVVCGQIRKHFGPVSAGGPRIFGLSVRDNDDQACVDDFVLNIDNLSQRVRSLLPDVRMAG